MIWQAIVGLSLIVNVIVLVHTAVEVLADPNPGTIVWNVTAVASTVAAGWSCVYWWNLPRRRR